MTIQNTWSQNTYLNYQKGFKLYNLSSYEKQTSVYTNAIFEPNYSISSVTVQILRPTIAFQWKSNTNNFHEIELTNLILSKKSTTTEIISQSPNIGQITDGNNVISSLISFRYEYILNFNKRNDKQLVPSLGFAINPYFSQNNFRPKTANMFSTSQISFGTKAFITPRITYYLSSKLFLDFNLPLCFFDSHYLRKRNDAFSVESSGRIVNSFNFSLIPNFISGRIGVGVKI
jgi:hypothetical protein